MFYITSPFIDFMDALTFGNSSDSFGLPAGDLSSLTFSNNILVNFLGWTLSILGFLAIIGFVVAGIMYIISAGDDDKVKRAKKILVYSIIGLIVALLGYVIILAIDARLNTRLMY